MKIQRKCLTADQKKQICDRSFNGTDEGCNECPLHGVIMDKAVCDRSVIGLEIEIKEYWDKEIEVEL